MSSAVTKKSRPAQAGGTVTSGSFCLPDFLRTELEAAEKLPRSEATRRRLLIAAAELMRESGFNDLKVADICKRAGFAHGTFYLHWQDRRGVAHDVLNAFMNTIRLRRPPRRDGQDFFQRLIAGHLYYIDVYRQNVGLMRCQGQLADQMEEFARIGLQANLSLAQRVIKAAGIELAKSTREAGDSRADATGLATALSCIVMVDKLLHEVFVRKLDLGLDDAGLAECLSRSWYRALIGHDPGQPA